MYIDQPDFINRTTQRVRNEGVQAQRQNKYNEAKKKTNCAAPFNKQNNNNSNKTEMKKGKKKNVNITRSNYILVHFHIKCTFIAHNYSEFLLIDVTIITEIRQKRKKKKK